MAPCSRYCKGSERVVGKVCQCCCLSGDTGVGRNDERLPTRRISHGQGQTERGDAGDGQARAVVDDDATGGADGERDPQLATQLEAICAAHPDYSHVLNGRFKGGHITRHYGNPAQNIHAVQLELGQCTNMEEFEPFRYRADLAEPTQVVLKELLQGLLAWGEKHYKR